MSVPRYKTAWVCIIILIQTMLTILNIFEEKEV